MIKKIEKLEKELGLEINELWWSAFDHGWVCHIDAPEGWGFGCQYHATPFVWEDPHRELSKAKVWDLVEQYAREEAAELCKCVCGYWENEV